MEPIQLAHYDPADGTIKQISKTNTVHEVAGCDVCEFVNVDWFAIVGGGAPYKVDLSSLTPQESGIMLGELIPVV